MKLDSQELLVLKFLMERNKRFQSELEVLQLKRDIILMEINRKTKEYNETQSRYKSILHTLSEKYDLTDHWKYDWKTGEIVDDNV